MAIIGSDAISVVQSLQRGLRRWATERYETLVAVLSDHEQTPNYLDGEQAVRVLVCLHTGLQPSEYDRLAILERVPFLERTAEALGIDTYDFQDDDECEEQPKPRFKSPHCPECGSKTKVQKGPGENKYRYLKCLDPHCGHTFKLVRK